MAWELFSERRAQLVLREAASASNRVTAIVSGALLDDGIEHLLRANFVHQSASVFKRVLSTPSAKIEMAHALGFFGEDATSDLRDINWIRNQFAHKLFMTDSTLETISFETTEIARRCRQLRWTDRVLFWGRIPAGKTEADVRAEPRFRFVHTVSLFADCIALVLNEYPSILLVPGPISPCIVEHAVMSTPQNRQHPQRPETPPSDSRGTTPATGDAGH